MAIDTEYDPKYVTLGDIPIEGPDTYSNSEKRRALFEAEGEFELDVNGGQEIPQSEVYDSHKVAVANLATYHLAKTAMAPDDTTLGDMSDAGFQSLDYAETYLETYNRLIDKINSSSHAGDSGTTHASGSVNTRDSTGMDDEYPYNRDDRFPDE